MNAANIIVMAVVALCLISVGFAVSLGAHIAMEALR